MKSKKLPRVKHLVAFLQSKGWELTGKNDLYYIFNPPTDIKWEKHFNYFVPVHEKFSDYPDVIENMIRGLSELYEMDFTDLYNMLCQTKTELKKSIATRKAILAQAS